MLQHYDVQVCRSHCSAACMLHCGSTAVYNFCRNLQRGVPLSADFFYRNGATFCREVCPFLQKEIYKFLSADFCRNHRFLQKVCPPLQISAERGIHFLQISAERSTLSADRTAVRPVCRIAAAIRHISVRA